MKQLLAIIFLLTSLSIYGQQAPNFIITDYNNVDHDLYNDYLNNGKVVLLKIMFVDCPPCNSIAPSVQSLWEDFGGVGNPDVQFFELSNKSFDSNQDMQGFANRHGLTFPGAGADGGSLDAVNPYTSGQFGTFFGTPTFVVIGTDGSVEFRVPFNQVRETIEEKLNNNRVAVSGKVTNPDGLAMPNVQIYYQNPGESKEFITTTDFLGEYTFFEDDIAAKAGCVIFPEFDQPNHSSDISTRDIIAVLGHILTRDTLATPLDILIADTNESGSVTVKDLVEIQKLILGLEQRFNREKGYAFICTSDNIPGNSTGRTQLLFTEIFDGNVVPDFTGDRVGNVIK